MTKRLIEEWLPIAALGEESVRERRSMTALPPIYYLHVWWARRPLVASRAAVLASLLPADADREKFLHVLGIHGDPVRAKQLLDHARRTGERVADPYGYSRAFSYTPSEQERAWLRDEVGRTGVVSPRVLDPTAGGGSIPFESVRLGFDTQGNDLNAVATLVLKATVENPVEAGPGLADAFSRLASEWLVRVREQIAQFFPPSRSSDEVDTTYLWARTIRCPYCGGLVPLSPNWNLAPGVGARLRPNTETRTCGFDVVAASQQSEGTVTQGDGRCPFADCGRGIDGDEIKRQAQAGEMGEQLYAVVFKRRTEKRTKTGKTREAWERGYRAPRPEDDVSAQIAAYLTDRMPEWEALDVIPSESIGDLSNYDRGHRMYGMFRWRDFFSPRQLMGHVVSVEMYRQLVSEREAVGLSDTERAAFLYLALTMDRMLDYNARQSTWDWTTGRARHVFVRHNFSTIWAYVEIAPHIEGLGYDWAIGQTEKCIRELVGLLRPDASGTNDGGAQRSLVYADDDAPKSTVTITNGSADSLSHLEDGSIDAVVMDPPYYDNVMYAELSDFFYVWLKRTAGHVYPELFTRQLTDKDHEAVANVAKFAGEKGAKALASRDYQERMAAIFAECRRVLKADGILTLMFTHKATGAWDALTSGLLEAGFTITASWPINTESEGSLHIKDKAAANSTIFLVCRPRDAAAASEGEALYWEDVEPRIAARVRQRIEEFEKAGIRGVDLYLSCFGPALEVLAQHWPLKRGQPRPAVAAAKGRGKKKIGDATDPYAVTPEDALDAARREVKKWKLDKLLRTSRHAEMDGMTEWFVLAWDAFKAPQFPYDEALRLARVVGVDLDREIIGRLAEKKGGNVVLWDSARRAAKGALGPTDGSRAMIDALHHAAWRARDAGLQAAREQLEKSKADQAASFKAALTAVLEVLPVGKTFTKVEGEKGAVAEASSDFDALEQLRRLAYAEQVPKPVQLAIWEDATA